MVGGNGAVATSDATLDGAEIYDPSTGRCSTAGRMCKARFHPTQKPVEIMRWCIDMLPAKGGGRGDTIIDPYMGSGSTAIAAIQAGVKFIGVETRERWFDVTVARIHSFE